MTPDPQIIDAIYQAYPRHVAPRAAKAAIWRAIARLTKDASGLESVDGLHGDELSGTWLLDRVQLFAKAWEGRDKRYCPHPATWFNRGSYDDDEREWNRAGESKEGKRNDRDGPPLKIL